ncbi:molybdenum cofactor biosynthesis protein MoaE [Sphingomonas ginkgonis]|uniref:Molybdopterin synthase catalytic subunit n=2 Tax=Sphingomonas ginkgonis TaxID=2315330 RepID=A0A429V6I2_9SPHN|nr:molybdenum cofactor biosynthesis protein MoaE [Sphingomonas ginkgonis]
MDSGSTSSPRSAAADPRRRARLAHGAFDPAAELEALIAASDGAGAVVSFTGLTRGHAGAVGMLVLDHHPVLTECSLQDIAAEALARFDIGAAWVVHRCGAVPAGEPIVFAGAASRHRRAAFEAADYMMDRLKTDAVFWKREVGPAGERWIEPTAGDYDDRSRWNRDDAGN